VVRTVKDNGVESMSSNGCVEDEIRDQVEAIYDDIPLAALLRHPLLRHPAQSPREVVVSAVVAVVAVHCLVCYQLMVVVGRLHSSNVPYDCPMAVPVDEMRMGGRIEYNRHTQDSVYRLHCELKCRTSPFFW